VATAGRERPIYRDRNDKILRGARRLPRRCVGAGEQQTGKDDDTDSDSGNGRERLMTVKLKPLADQVMLITGASSGIGLVTARAAARTSSIERISATA
jgi:hypothetical protein